ncbi:hypothetical protein RHECNPAF_430065 [Rhizobium etli CNPAF512]|nr:hypothetical protein RHECNPAF_430065 [Rhizobium etli CNPAF512]
METRQGERNRSEETSSVHSIPHCGLFSCPRRNLRQPGRLAAVSVLIHVCFVGVMQPRIYFPRNEYWAYPLDFSACAKI